MTAKASGTDNVYPFNPQSEMHYGLSEMAEAELSNLFEALESIADLTAAADGDTLHGITPARIAPIIRAMSDHGARIVASTRSLPPRRR